ncbi:MULTISPECIES: hypothetical protein [unclassified Moorena]|nr:MULTISPECIES: hypothetical protein [unclassified Moorena]
MGPYLPISLSNQSTLFECNSVLPLLPTPDSLLPLLNDSIHR